MKTTGKLTATASSSSGGRTRLLAVACTALGFGAGVLAAPLIRGPGPGSAGQQPATVDVARSDSTEGMGTARVPGQSRGPADEAARLALAAASLKRVAEHQPAGSSGSDPAPAGQQQQDRKQHVAVEQLPPALRQVVMQVAQGRSVRNLTVERRAADGRRGWETDFELDGVAHELKVEESGKILETEIEWAISELPAPVTSTIERILPGASLMNAEREQDGDATPFFEINLKHNGVLKEIEVTEDGRLLRSRDR